MGEDVISKFKAGQYVKFTRQPLVPLTALTVGKAYKVMSVDEPFSPGEFYYRILDDNGHEDGWIEGILELAPFATQSMFLKIGDKVRYKKFHNIVGTITKLDQSGLWIVNDTLVAREDELELDDVNTIISPWISLGKRKCTCGSTSVGSDRHSDWCDVK